MNNFFNIWRIYHLLSKTTETDKSLTKKHEDWPVEWKTTYYKQYPRLRSTKLAPTEVAGDLLTALFKRSSKWPSERTSLEDRTLSTLLKYACGTTTNLQPKRLRRVYPSAGGRYPIETYLLVLSPTEELAPGLYHYNVKDHALTLLLEKKFDTEELREYFTNVPLEKISTFVILTAIFDRTQMKYGERGYRYILLEAGHISQNISLLAEHLDLTCTVLGGSSIDHNVEKLLDIDGVSESFVLALALGKNTKNQ